MTALFLPERHPVRDFFVLDALDVAPRSDMASMAHPIFSLSTRPETRILRYAHDQTVIEIQPSAKGLEDALDRLAGTRIKTNIVTGDEVSTQNFGLIEWYDYNRKGSGFAERLRYLDIKLSDWLFRAIDAEEVLPIAKEYFRLRRPLDRRVYEIARKHCGAQATWRISIDKLQRRAGSKQERKHFAAHLRGMVQTNHLPDYALTLEGEHAVFWRRGERERAAKSARVAESTQQPIERRILISSAAIEQLYEIAPRWDKHLLESLYIEWARTKDPARSEDARFLGWVRSYTKGKSAP